VTFCQNNQYWRKQVSTTFFARVSRTNFWRQALNVTRENDIRRKNSFRTFNVDEIDGRWATFKKFSLLFNSFFTHTHAFQVSHFCSFYLWRKENRYYYTLMHSSFNIKKGD